MLEKIVIRDAVIDDLPAIVDIYNSTIPGRMVTADTTAVSIEERKPWFDSHSEKERPLWVAEYNGDVCGWISFESFYGRPAYRSTAEISVYINQKFRGKGIGTFLLQQAIDHCPELQIKTILAFIFSHNKPSLGLFERFGFQKWADLPHVAELDGIERDLIIMGKRVIQ